ncbi:MAG: uracil-DNA glycosylase family protein [Salinibacterium sp.]|nr:uracil-DNA glycosylase family protein [Salinibacterium sp.]
MFQLDSAARVLIAGQAPGRQVHRTGVPFDDASGERLRDWMGISRAVFHDASRVAILPMAFCYPGRGRYGDLPPPGLCAATWRSALLAHLDSVRLTLVIGAAAASWHLETRKSLTDSVRSFRDYLPSCIPLPHPSPRNNPWLAKNPWFARDVLPELRSWVRSALGG